MDGMLALAVLAAFGGTFGGLAWLAARVRRRGAGGALLGPFEEVWHPAAHRARIEVEVYEQRAAPSPSPDDPLASAPGTTPKGACQPPGAA